MCLKSGVDMLEQIENPNDLKKINKDELEKLAVEIREFLIDKVSRTGGHLSPNLGVVELTIALLYIFDCPKDNIIWDVGHQSYVYKILTGRKKGFDTLRMMGGMSGYPSPKESPYDTVHAGHSSTSISIASGIAKAKINQKENSATIVVIGDGAFTSGLAYEGINTVAHDNLPVIIILNDNGMSISKNVGGISIYFNKLRISQTYQHFKRRLVSVFLHKVPIIGHFFVKTLYKIKESLKPLVIKKNFFEDLGISYNGPIDGHNLKMLIEIFQEIKDINKPILIHVVTTKGKGYKPSEENPGKYHGISGVAVNGDSCIPLEAEGPSYSEIFGNTLVKIAEQDNKIFAITAAMKSGTGLKEFAQRFPDRFTDVGIAEQHAVDYAFGLSIEGYKPVVAIYSTFLQRAFDQLVHDVSIANAKILFCLDRAGLVPCDGETHQGVFDIAYLRLIPNFTIMLPSCKTELEMMLEFSLFNLSGPICIRYPKSEALDYPEYDPKDFPIQIGKGVKVKEGVDIILVSLGTMLGEALKVSNELYSKGISVEIYHLRYAKPINMQVTQYLSSDNRPVLILEEGVYSGSAAEFLTVEILKIKNKVVQTVNLPDAFPQIGTREELLNQYSLTSEKISHKIVGMLNPINLIGK
jgi:1-deoxy-D-xylulose-5-phosphate synthase